MGEVQAQPDPMRDAAAAFDAKAKTFSERLPAENIIRALHKLSQLLRAADDYDQPHDDASTTAANAAVPGIVV